MRTILCLALLAVPRASADERDDVPMGVVARIGSRVFRHASFVNAVTFSPDGHALATLTHEGTLTLWDATTGRPRWQTATTNDAYEGRLAFAADGKRLAVVTPTAFRIVAAADGKVLVDHTPPKVPGEETRCVAVAPDLTQWARGCVDGSVRVHDAVTGAERCRATVGDKAKSQFPLRLAFAPNAATLFAAVYGRPEVVGHDARTGRPTVTLTGDQPGIRSLAVSPDGRFLATLERGFEKGDIIILWDLKNQKPTRRIERSFPDPIGSAFSPDGKTLAVGNQGRDVVLLNFGGGPERRLAWHPSAIAVAFTADGATLATADNSGGVALWDVAAGKLRPVSAGASGALYVRGFRDGRLVTVGDDLVWWDWRSGKRTKTLSLGESSLWSVAVSPDGRLATGTTKEHALLLVDTATGATVRTLTGPTQWLGSTAFSPDGRTLVSAGRFDPRLLVWDVASGRLLHELKSHTRYVDHATFSPDGRLIASWAADGAAQGDYDVRLWDRETGRLLRRLTPGRGSAMGGVAFSPDGRLVVTAGGDPGRLNNRGEVELWEVATGTRLQTFDGHAERVVAVAFSPDGRTLATSGIDKTLRLWEVASGRERRRLVGHAGYVHSLAFAPDGRHLAAGSNDAPVFVWDAYADTTPGRATWDDLAAADATVAFAAVCRLVARPADAVALLRTPLRPAVAADAKAVEAWVRDLDSSDFGTREKAEKELMRVAEVAGPALRKAVEGASAEVQKRLKRILERSESASLERLREGRAIEVLEHAGTAAARRLLEELANGAADAPRTRGAREALARQSATQQGGRND